MTQTFSSPQVLCRPAIARDHADITEFCKGIWEGDDYVPDVWQHWFNDPHGILVTAEYNGHAIGCGKLSLIAEGQWWLEGLRVDPNHQGLKVGSRIHNYLTDWWIEYGNGTLRLMTDAGNLAVQHLCNRTGYVKTHEVCAYQASPIAEPAENFSPVTNIREAALFATQSESIKATDGLIDFGWRICKPDEHAIASHSDHKADYFHTFYWWRNKQGLFSAWENDEEDRRTLVIGVVACAMNDMPALLMDARRLAAQEKFDSIFQIAFDILPIISQLNAAGFEKRWRRSNAFVFEKSQPSRA